MYSLNLYSSNINFVMANPNMHDVSEENEALMKSDGNELLCESIVAIITITLHLLYSS